MRKIFILIISILSVASAIAQNHSNGHSATSEPFNGVVTRTNGSGIKARVEVVGRDKSTLCDGKGRFGLTNINPDDTLRITIHRDEFLIPVLGRRSLRITFSDDRDYRLFRAEESPELINLGADYVKRREIIDYSSGISGDRLRSTGCFNLADALKMLYPGLYESNGELCFRTTNSINSSSAVLVLCDGIDVNINTINIHDVENVEIIKGSNMYGFRGVNGVIKVTTRKAGE